MGKLKEETALIKSTYTYVVLEISQNAFDEIKRKLEAAGYQHTFSMDGKTIDLHGIAVEAETPVPF